MVWDVHMIHPNALLGSSGKLKSVNAITMASGYDPIPPLVTAILKLAKIKPIKIAENGSWLVSTKEKEVT